MKKLKKRNHSCPKWRIARLYLSLTILVWIDHDTSLTPDQSGDY